MSAEAVALALAGGAVAWDGTDLGLLPRLPAEEEGLAVDLDEGDVPVLIDALDSAETFVTAHVLLTRLAGGPSETFPTWRTGWPSRSRPTVPPTSTPPNAPPSPSGGAGGVPTRSSARAGLSAGLSKRRDRRLRCQVLERETGTEEPANGHRAVWRH